MSNHSIRPVGCARPHLFSSLTKAPRCKEGNCRQPKGVCAGTQADLFPSFSFTWISHPQQAEWRRADSLTPALGWTLKEPSSCIQMCCCRWGPARDLTVTSQLRKQCIKQGISNLLEILDPRFCHQFALWLLETHWLRRVKSWHPVVCFMCACGAEKPLLDAVLLALSEKKNRASTICFAWYPRCLYHTWKEFRDLLGFSCCYYCIYCIYYDIRRKLDNLVCMQILWYSSYLIYHHIYWCTELVILKKKKNKT